MPEYSYKDIIIDPEDPRLKDAIGKEIYSNNDIHLIVENAKCDVGRSVLIDVVFTDLELESGYFLVEDIESKSHFYMHAIIIRKEDPPEYVPFTSGYEFILQYDEYKGIRNIDTDDTVADIICLDNGYGMWVKLEDDYLMVTRISDYGIEVDGEVVNWERLLKDYKFIYDEPCGKLNKEVDNV